MMYGIRRTTVYLPEELKDALERTAAAADRSEAELIREGVALVTRGGPTPQLGAPLFRSAEPHLAESVDEALEGFGER